MKSDKSEKKPVNPVRLPFTRAPVSLNEWYRSPLGLYLLEHLQQRLNPILSTSFGYFAVVLGDIEDQPRITENCPIKHVFHMGKEGRNNQVLSDSGHLPVANDSVDLVVLMHSLSRSGQPHALLREAHRVLIPEGKLIIIEFNPFSLWGIRHWLQGWLDDAPWAGHYYTANRLRDWTRLLGFEPLYDSRCGYVLPFNVQAMIHRSRLFSKFSERWLSFSGALNILAFEKRLIALTPLRRRWVNRQILPPKVVRPTVSRGYKYDR